MCDNLNIKHENAIIIVFIIFTIEMLWTLKEDGKWHISKNDFRVECLMQEEKGETKGKLERWSKKKC